MFLLSVRVSLLVLWVIFSAWSHVKECYAVGLLLFLGFSLLFLYSLSFYIFEGEVCEEIFVVLPPLYILTSQHGVPVYLCHVGFWAKLTTSNKKSVGIS